MNWFISEIYLIQCEIAAVHLLPMAIMGTRKEAKMPMIFSHETPIDEQNEQAAAPILKFFNIAAKSEFSVVAVTSIVFLWQWNA